MEGVYRVCTEGRPDRGMTGSHSFVPSQLIPILYPGRTEGRPGLGLFSELIYVLDVRLSRGRWGKGVSRRKGWEGEDKLCFVTKLNYVLR